MGDEKLRLFTAVRVPKARLEWLDAAASGLKELPGARWTALENQHVTLNFLGWVPAERLPEVTAAVDSAAARRAPAPVSLGALGAFPDEGRARVLWAGLVDPESVLAGLARDAGEALRAVGYEPEARAYVPHLTLARFKTPQRLTGILPELGDAPAPFDVDRVTLYRSRLGPAGARYEVLHEAYLSSEHGGTPGSR